MAKFNIISKDGATILYSGCPVYNGNFMKVSYLEFREICSSTPINWQVGDYVDYDKTGLRYKIYNIPQPTKNARSGQSGKSFVYNNVQLFADTKELEIALFRDLVVGDNYIHFSTQQAISTYENVQGIANRLQVCMDDFSPNNWQFVVDIASKTFNDDYNEDYLHYDSIVNEVREFTMSGGSIMDALQKIYEVWDKEIGWFFSRVNNKNIITLSKFKDVKSSLVTETYLYGKGKGLKIIKKSQANKDEMATRLYIYGSNRNIRSGYYRGKDILNAESVDIQNLMIPINNWGKTENSQHVLKPDARKAFIQNNSAVTSFGLIPKSAYFDGNELEEIYPTLKNVTIGEVRSAKQAIGETEYVPIAGYSASDRVDEIIGVVNPQDDGATDSTGGKTYSEVYTKSTSQISKSLSFTIDEIGDKELTFDGCTAQNIGINDCNISLYSDIQGSVVTDSSITTIIEYRLYTKKADENEWTLSKSEEVAHFTGNITFNLPELSAPSISANSSAKVGYYVRCHNGASNIAHTITITIGSGNYNFTTNYSLANNFKLTLRQIGFNIAQRATLGDGNMVHFLDGMCAGRSFLVKRTKYISANDTWELTMVRGVDSSTSYLYPNTNYPISIGDHFVLLDIAMPEIYINIASSRLLTAGNNLLNKTSRIEPYYEPEVDAKKVLENITSYPLDESYKLREGKFLVIKDTDIVDNVMDCILVDSITITESDSQIPTYRLTLREKKKLTFQQTTANAINNLNQKVADTSGTIPVSGTANYEDLTNLPKIDNVDLLGNLSSYSDLGLVNTEMIEKHTQSLVEYLKANYPLLSTGYKVINGTSDQFLHADGSYGALALSSLKIVQSGVEKGTYDPLSNSELQTINIDSGGASSLTDLTDVDIASVTNGDMIVYDNTSPAKWRNKKKVDLGFALALHTHTKSQITDLGNVALQKATNNLISNSNEINMVDNNNSDTLWFNYRGSQVAITDYVFANGRQSRSDFAKIKVSGVKINSVSANDLVLANGNGSVSQADLSVGSATNATKANNVVNQNDSSSLKIWAGTSAPSQLDDNTIYFIF